MQVTEIKVFPVDEEKLKAFVSIVIDRCFMVNDIKVINGRDGLFISMPSRRKKNGKFKDVAHPLNNETRQMIEGLILTDYRRVLAEREDALEDVAEEPLDRREVQAPEPQVPESPIPVEVPESPIPVEVPESQMPVEVVDPQPQESHEEPRDFAVADEPLAAAEPLAATPVAADERPAEKGKSLEEVTEMHLRDSFWSG